LETIDLSFNFQLFRIDHLKAIRALLAIMLVAVPGTAAADLVYVIHGVDDPLKSNILSHIDTVQLGPQVRLADRDFDRVLAETISKAEIALRPYGFYAAEVIGRISRNSENQPVVELRVNPGPPIIIERLQLEIVGKGSESRSLRSWQRKWPLEEGDILNQVVWEQQKQHAIEVANSIGYLSAEFTERTLEIDLERNRASVKLTLDTGPRFVMGDIDFGEHVLKPGILEFVPRFERGDPYTTYLMDKFRSDLWQTGYFTDVDVAQIKVPDSEPPRVDLKVRTNTEYRNRYTGALGFGTDTGARLQANWSRHPISANGDRIDLGIGWQEPDDEFAIRATYRRPRSERNREYWTADTVLTFENTDLEFKLNPDDEDFVTFANGNINERHLRLGRLKIRNLGGGETQLFETPFVQYISSERQFEPILQPTLLNEGEGFDQLLRGIDNAISIGIEYGFVRVLGRGFDTQGHRERAWIFHSNEAFGSEIEFTQLYLSTHSSYLRGDRWKFTLRAEAGYTDAEVDEFTIDTGGGQLDLSRTRMPKFYRFEAGGSHSVRGYGFETLSNNDIGSNHVVTASAEVEMKVLEKWSVAAFVDIGNAFNDWSDAQLKTGIGVGLRWYSIAGPISVDFAQAQDYTGKPWRIHFTIGVPLL